MQTFCSFSEGVFSEYGMHIVIMAGYQDLQDETLVIL